MAKFPHLKLSAALCLLSAAALAPRPADAGQINMTASATHGGQPFTKFLYSWPLPPNTLFTGLSGKVWTDTPVNSFNVALIGVAWDTDGTCPVNGEYYYDWGPMFAAHPGLNFLYATILKKPVNGYVEVATQFTLPVGFSISTCVVVMLDGSHPLSGGQYTMGSSMVMHYTTGPTPSPPLGRLEMGNEFCFGMPYGGCQLHSASNSVSFGQFSGRMAQATQLVGLHGDLSYGSLDAPYSAHFGASVPSGPWSATADFYIIKNCASLPTGITGPGDIYSMIPADSLHVLSETINGSGMEDIQRPVHVDYSTSALIIPQGGCLAHVVKRTGDGGMDAETQIRAFVRAYPYTDRGLRMYDGTGTVKIATEAGTPASPLRMRIAGGIYGIPLVDPADPAASQLRINPGAGVKALRKLEQ